MDLKIIRRREIEFTNWEGERKKAIQEEYFDSLNLGGDLPYHIVNASNPKLAYVEIVKSLSNPTKQPIFSPGDWRGEGEPIGYRILDWAADHIRAFNEWTVESHIDGWTIEFKLE